MGQLSEKVAIVTGGARGIGGEIALALAKEKVQVAAADILLPDSPDFQGLLLKAKKQGLDILPLTVDVTRSDSVAKMVEAALDRFGRLDILVNAAGIVFVKFVADMTEEDWDRVLDVNVKGVFLCCKAAIPHLVAGGEGRIVNIASISGRIGRPGYAHYAASKHAVLGFTKSLAHELAPDNVTVNAVNPGIVKTSMWKNDLVPHFAKQRGLDHETTFQEIIKDRIPLGRPQTETDIAEAVLFLCKAANITGTGLTIDGGCTML